MLRTERLVLRQWRESDREPFAAINRDPLVMEFYPRVLTDEESNVLFEKFKRHWEEHGYGFWAVEVPGVAEFVGYVGLNYWNLEMPFAPCVDVGWRLGSEYWGKGYATEGARAALQYGFEELGLEEIVAMATVENVRSRRVMERLGMDWGEDFAHPKVPEGDRLSMRALYRIKRGAC